MTAITRPTEGKMAEASAGTETPSHLKFASASPQSGVEFLGRLYGEGLRFMYRRWEANRRAMREITAGASVPDTLAAWSRYFDAATRDYSEEFESLAEIYADSAGTAKNVAVKAAGAAPAAAEPVASQA